MEMEPFYLRLSPCAGVKVKAVKMGNILVIDEADKAPTNVTCILKTLVESGEMILADGRRIVSGNSVGRKAFFFFLLYVNISLK